MLGCAGRVSIVLCGILIWVRFEFNDSKTEIDIQSIRGPHSVVRQRVPKLQRRVVECFRGHLGAEQQKHSGLERQGETRG